MSAAPDFEGTSLLDSPAYLISEAESAAETPEQLTLLRRLRAWFITPLVETLIQTEPGRAVREAMVFWRRNASGWSDYAPEVFQLLRDRGVLAAPEELVSALDGGLPDPDEVLHNLTPRARVYVGAYWRVLEAMLSTHHREVVEGIRQIADGDLPDVVDAPGLETYVAMCQALAVAGLHDQVPSTTVEALAAALWQSFRRALQDEIDSDVFDTALASSRETAKAADHSGPAVSRWRRRRGAGPQGVHLSEDFDSPLPEFEDY